MIIQEQNLKGRAKNCWAQEIHDINETIARLKGDSAPWWGIAFNWSVLDSQAQKLIKKFYFHCLDYVILTDFGQLFDYGKNYYFENCSLQTLLNFLKFFPVFPSHYEWLQSVDIFKLVDHLVSIYLLHQNKGTLL